MIKIASSLRRTIVTLAAAMLVVGQLLLSAAIAPAKTLQGSVEEQSEILRLAPPSAGAPGQQDHQTHSLRIARQAPSANLSSRNPLIDPGVFSRPLKGNADQNGFRLGVLRPDSFNLPPQNKFDIGAERESREMMIAWERWHQQLSGAIYQRWSERAQTPGRATLKITVTRDHHIMPRILSSSGGREFDADLMDAITSLDGNPGLEFPAKSMRQQVTFEADYIAGTDVMPGYSWVKNDYEHIRQDY